MTNMQDRRKEFKNKYWQQGNLLITRITSKWSDEQKQETADKERRCCFVDFNLIKPTERM